MSLSLNWMVLVFVCGVAFTGFWLVSGCFNNLIQLIVEFLINEFKLFYGVLKMKFSLIMFIVLFMYILLVNILGLLPYVFAVSSHFVFSLGLSLPVWMGYFSLGWICFTNSAFCHLIPTGTPVLLISFMAIIETVSILIRPWSLSIRLMANMVSGHLLLSLLGNCSVLVSFVQAVLVGFEFFVCFIQAYVFSALLVMYSGEA